MTCGLVSTVTNSLPVSFPVSLALLCHCLVTDGRGAVLSATLYTNGGAQVGKVQRVCSKIAIPPLQPHLAFVVIHKYIVMCRMCVNVSEHAYACVCACVCRGGGHQIKQLVSISLGKIILQTIGLQCPI